MSPISIRSSLKPYWHRQRRKWYPRGTYPTKNAAGQPDRKRGFLGDGRDTKALCQQDCDRLNAELEAAALAEAPEATFAEAALVYLRSGGDRRFLTKTDGSPSRVLSALAAYRVNEIDDAVMTRVAAEIYPGCAPVTISRQLYTPVISVLRLASKGKRWKPDLKRPEGYAVLKPRAAPRADWFEAVRPYCRPQMWALILFDAIHGRRAGEALGLTPGAYDPERGAVYIGKTKTHEPVTVTIAAPVADAIAAYNWQAGPGLFGPYTTRNRRNLYRDLARVCELASVPYFTPHQAGRHAFAKRMLEAGKSLKHVQQAGKWKTMVVAALYGHMEHSEVDAETVRLGAEWVAGMGQRKDTVVKLPRRG